MEIVPLRSNGKKKYDKGGTIELRKVRQTYLWFFRHYMLDQIAIFSKPLFVLRLKLPDDGLNIANFHLIVSWSMCKHCQLFENELHFETTSGM